MKISETKKTYRAIRFENSNGSKSIKVENFLASSGDVFTQIGSAVKTLDDRVYLSYIEEGEKSKGSFKEFDSSGTLQYDGTRQSVNEEGFASRGMVLRLLENHVNLRAEFLPYRKKDLLSPITYGELGYLLTYAVGGNLPKLGLYKPLDSRMKLSIINIQSSQGKKPEYRLSQYTSSKVFDDYLEDIRQGSRPIPVPLFYGYMHIFKDEGVTLLGQVPRRVLVKIVEGLK